MHPTQAPASKSSNLPPTYDLVNWVHYLWWNYRCNQAGGEEFQSLFDKLMNKADSGYTPIRPYGNVGDRKCDGMIADKGIFFQVYSPDEMTQQATKKKINEDLDGAIVHWKEHLKEWHFVYNVRRGLPPDVQKLILEKRIAHPDIHIKALKNEDLWNLFKALPYDQRCEVLGGPPGLDRFYLSPTAFPHEMAARYMDGRLLLIQDVLSPINLEEAATAIEPALSQGPPVFIRAAMDQSWDERMRYQYQIVNEILEKSRDLLPRFSVFSLAPIPLVAHLGFLLSDRVEADLFQFDREKRTWKWDPGLESPPIEFQVSGIPSKPISEKKPVVLRISLSASVSAIDSSDAFGGDCVEIDLAVPDPDVLWLRSKDQLTYLERAYRKVLKGISRFIPNCTEIHVFYAGPTGGAFSLGRSINPRMNPPVQLYEFNRQSFPHYQKAILLTAPDISKGSI